ncbi:MAG: sugar transferase [Nitrospinales bacterium]
MLQQQVNIIITVLMVLDALCVICAGYGAYYFRVYESYGTWTIDTNVFSASVFLVMFLNNYMMGRFKLYGDIRPSSYINLTWRIFKAIVVDFGTLSVGIVLLQQKDYSRLFLLSFAGLCFLFLASYRVLIQLYLDKTLKSGDYSRRILIVGNLERGRFVTGLLNSQLSWGHDVVGQLSIEREECLTDGSLGCIEDLPQILREHTIDEVVFAVEGNRDVPLSPYLKNCKKMGIPVRILPGLWNTKDKSLSIEKCQDVPFLTIRTSNIDAAGLLYKRVLDLVGGVVGTVIFLINYPFVAIAIKFDSEGPVLYKQKRMGQHGRTFNLYKFRTMYQDADKRRQDLVANNVMNGAMFKMKDDPRITKVGRWLRKTSIDEIPQFLNVLTGEMSLVGTRPPMIEEVEEYKLEHLKRISNKPGITGLWQVSGRNIITDFDEIVDLDCKYSDNWRFSDDLKILLKTVVVVLQRKGAI